MNAEEKAAEIAKAVSFDFDAFGWGKPKGDELDRLAIDSDFTGDIRNLLIDFQEDDFNLAFFLGECESDRYIDLRRAYDVLQWMATPDSYMADQLSHIYMQNSLCPVHRVDWAICFDDEPEDCAQIRAIFPHGHDT